MYKTKVGKKVNIKRFLYKMQEKQIDEHKLKQVLCFMHNSSILPTVHKFDYSNRGCKTYLGEEDFNTDKRLAVLMVSTRIGQ